MVSRAQQRLQDKTGWTSSAHYWWSDCKSRLREGLTEQVTLELSVLDAKRMEKVNLQSKINEASPQ